MATRTYVVVLVRRGKDDKERRRVVYVKEGEDTRIYCMQQAINWVEKRTVPSRDNPNPDLLGWRVVRVSEGGYH